MRERRGEQAGSGWSVWLSQAPPPCSSHWPSSIPVRSPAIQRSSSGEASISSPEGRQWLPSTPFRGI